VLSPAHHLLVKVVIRLQTLKVSAFAVSVASLADTKMENASRSGDQDLKAQALYATGEYIQDMML
jgi:hypothetical protein